MPAATTSKPQVLAQSTEQGQESAGQDDKEAPAEKSPTQVVYELSQKAKTAEEYSEIIKTCLELRNAAPNADGKKYPQQLAAWALNRRGEIYVKQAGEAEDPQKADEIDKKATADFTEAVKLNPGYWKARHNLGVAFTKK